MIFQLTTHTITIIFSACGGSRRRASAADLYEERAERSIHPSALPRGSDQLPWLVTQFQLYRPILPIQIRAGAKKPFGPNTEPAQLQSPNMSV